MEDDGFWADELNAKVWLGDGGMLADRGGSHQGAVLGVGPAPAGCIEVGGANRRRRVAADVVEQLIKGGQPNPAPGEHRQEEDCVHTLPQRPAHGKSLLKWAGDCPLPTKPGSACPWVKLFG